MFWQLGKKGLSNDADSVRGSVNDVVPFRAGVVG